MAKRLGLVPPVPRVPPPPFLRYLPPGKILRQGRMKTAPNWHSDLAFGKKYERLAIDLLEDGNVVTPPEGVKFSPWDFKHNGVPYEVKSDRRAADTGNICIEYEHTGIPSGIAITEAMEWIYFVIKKDGYYCYRIPTKDIRERVARDGTLKFYTDAGNSRFYLVPANEFAEYLWKQT